MTQLKWTFWFLSPLYFYSKPLSSAAKIFLYLTNVNILSFCHLHHLLQTSATHTVQITENKPKFLTKFVPLASWFLLLHCLNTTKIYKSDKIPSWDNTVLAVKLNSFSEWKVIVLGISDETSKIKCSDGNCCSNYVHEITLSHVLSDSGTRSFGSKRLHMYVLNEWMHKQR